MLFYPVFFLQGDFVRRVLLPISKAITPCVLVLVFCVLINLPINTAMIGNGWTDAFSFSLSWSVITETSFGYSWLISMTGCLVLLYAIFFSIAQKYKTTFLFLGSGLVLASFSWTGHAQMNEGWRGAIHQLSDVLHIFAGASWVGGLFALYYVLKQASNSESNIFVIDSIRAFSLLGMVSVSIIVFSGIINTWLILGNLPFGLYNVYQKMLSGKILLVVIMVALAIRNKVLLAPKLSQSNEVKESIVLLKKATMMEFVLGILVVLCVAIFGTLDPHAGDFCQVLHYLTIVLSFF